jgi:hypothetical protein
MAKDDKDEETLPLELQGGAGLTKIKKDSSKIWKAMQQRETQIAELREQNNADKATLVSMGIPRSSFAEVKRRASLDAEQRREHDFGSQIFGEAIGVPLAEFEPAEEKGDKNPRANPDTGGAKPHTAKKAGKAPAKGKKPSSVPLGGLSDAIEAAEATSKRREAIAEMDTSKPGLKLVN